MVKEGNIQGMSVQAVWGRERVDRPGFRSLIFLFATSSE